MAGNNVVVTHYNTTFVIIEKSFKYDRINNVIVNKVAMRRNGNTVQSVFSVSSDSSSFGPIGHISQVSADRLKGFIGYVGGGEGQDGRITPIEKAEHARFIGNVVREGIRRLESTGNTRLSIRTIVNNNTLESLRNQVQRAGGTIEACLPIRDNYTIVYMGYNTPDRELNEERRDSNETAISRARQRYENNPESIRELAKEILQQSNKYRVRVLDGVPRSFSESDYSQVNGLLSTFGYSDRDSRAAIENSQNIVGLVYNNVAGHHAVVGISITERRTIELTNGQVVQIAEVTDGTVSPSASGRGLYSRLLSNVFEHIADNRPELSLVFAESNTASNSILKAAALQGRSFAGILPNHANISDRQTGELGLESFVVTYLTREQLIASTRRLNAALELQQAIRN